MNQSTNNLHCSVAVQVAACPECRKEYPKKARRHRYAEKAAEELNDLKKERDEIVKKLGGE